MTREPRLETLAVHAAAASDPTTGAVAPPIHLSTTFERAPDGSFPSGNTYIRDNNPNRRAVETCLAQLEGGASCLAFASGMAATMAVFQSLAPGDHVVAPEVAYYGTGKLLRDHFSGWGLRSTFVDMTDLAAVEAALRPKTRLVWIETPSNPLISVTDIVGVVRLAHEVGAVVVCDNTWATPLLQQPLNLGVTPPAAPPASTKTSLQQRAIRPRPATMAATHHHHRPLPRHTRLRHRAPTRR